jgi:hypothetical protein
VFPMNMPGFTAESSLGPTIGIYRGNIVYGRLEAVKRSWGLPLSGTMYPALARGFAGLTPVPQESAFAILPLLERHQQCTTVYSGYITYPMRVCEFPNLPSDNYLMFFDPGAPGAMSRQAQVEPLFKFCRTIHGPWFATVVQQESCNFSEPDRFTLTISGAPQPVTLNWSKTMQDAPAAVGALGNLSATVPTCSCCGSKKQCPDGSCVPLSSSCGPTTPA